MYTFLVISLFFWPSHLYNYIVIWQFFSSTFGEFHIFAAKTSEVDSTFLVLQHRHFRRLLCADLGVVPARASPNVCGAVWRVKGSKVGEDMGMGQSWKPRPRIDLSTLFSMEILGYSILTHTQMRNWGYTLCGIDGPFNSWFTVKDF